MNRAQELYKNTLFKVKNHSIINFYAAHNNTLIMSVRKRTELNLSDKVRLIKAGSGKFHHQVAVETDDDDDTSDSMSVNIDSHFMKLWLRCLSSKTLQQTVA